MMIKHKDPDGKIKLYSVLEMKCKKRECFVPFSGNGQCICRLYELGRCPDEPDKYKKIIKIMNICPDCGCKMYNGVCTNCHEEMYIEDQYIELDMPISNDFQEKIEKVKTMQERYSEREDVLREM